MEAQKIMQNSQMKNQIHIATENKEGEEDKKIGRNDPCPCGNGKKVKKCDCKEYEYLRK